MQKDRPGRQPGPAADLVLEHAARGIALEDIEARLAELEQTVNPESGSERDGP